MSSCPNRGGKETIVSNIIGTSHENGYSATSSAYGAKNVIIYNKSHPQPTKHVFRREREGEDTRSCNAKATIAIIKNTIPTHNIAILYFLSHFDGLIGKCCSRRSI